MEFETLDEKDWSAIKDSSSKELTHDIHPYFAKFSPEIPCYLIREYTEEGDVVLDPFSGSGTTLVESLSLGRNAIGVDANPLACLIAKVKTTKLQDGDRRLAREVISDISTDVNSLYGQQNLLGKSFEEPEIPEFHNRDDWFNKNVQKELAVIKRRIEEVQNERVCDVLRIAFSRIIVGVSNQDSESRYTQVENNVDNKECLERFTERANYILDKLRSLETEVPESVEAEIYNEDSREMESVPSDCADFVVTSPPYLNSWDYGLYHKFQVKPLESELMI
jgi:site-specific DNA-methyltransferase (cytosine-N4-specific)